MDKVEVENDDKIEKLLELIHSKDLISRIKEESYLMKEGES